MSVPASPQSRVLLSWTTWISMRRRRRSMTSPLPSAPERSAEQTLSILAMLAERIATEEYENRKDGRSGSSRKQRSSEGRTGETPSRKDVREKKPQYFCIESIEPAVVSNVNADTGSGGTKGEPRTTDRVLSVETLAGYGPAGDWGVRPQVLPVALEAG